MWYLIDQLNIQFIKHPLSKNPTTLQKKSLNKFPFHNNCHTEINPLQLNMKHDNSIKFNKRNIHLDLQDKKADIV